MKFLSRSEWAFLAFVLVYSFIPAFGGLLRVVELSGGPAIAPPNLRAINNPLPIALHILGSFVFCVVGTTQFLPTIRRRTPEAHRALGPIVAAAGCISALTGIWMTHFFAFNSDLQGSALYWARILLGLAMTGLILKAICHIRVRDITEHGSAMIRAFAIAQGASTQAVFGIVWIVTTGAEATGPLRDALMISAWALNILVAEIIIRTLFHKSPSFPRNQGFG